MNGEILLNPVFYPPGQQAIPDVVIPDERQGWFNRTEEVSRYVFKGYPAVIIDNLKGHILRTSKRALMLNRLDEASRFEIANIMQIHDVGEIGEDKDMTTVDKIKDPKAAKGVEVLERQRALELLSEDDFLIWQRYEAAKKLIEGKSDPNQVKVWPAGVMAKIVDVSDCETVFHHWFLQLKSEVGERAYQFFPESAFSITLPRLRRYRQNITKLNLPIEYLETAEDLFKEIEVMGKLAGQKD
jgi:hypothetical protein